MSQEAQQAIRTQGSLRTLLNQNVAVFINRGSLFWAAPMIRALVFWELYFGAPDFWRILKPEESSNQNDLGTRRILEPERS